MPALAEFAVASLAVIAIPGPDQALITRNAVVHGRAAGVRTMLGGACGIAVHASAAALGVSALLAASSTAFAVLRMAGVAYLIFLGMRMLVRAADSEGAAGEDRARAGAGPFMQGLLSNTFNPKVALFFLTFLPQLMPTSSSALFAALGLSAVFALLYLMWFGALVGAVDAAGAWLRRPRVQGSLDRIAGIALIAFGLRLATQRQP